MNSKLRVIFNIDKLSLIFETPRGFIDSIEQHDEYFDFITRSQPKVFIFTKCFSRIPRTVKSYDLAVGDGTGITCVGQIHGEYESHIRLDVDNRFLYSGMLDVIYEFERRYGLKFKYVKNFDVCCDANQNLPYKLNRKLHSKNNEVSRLGAGKNLTKRGNQHLGIRVTENIKTVESRENAPVTYIFTLKTSRCRQPVLLRGYNKSEEIERSSHKYYIAEALNFDCTVHRLEVSTYWSEITQYSKRKPEFSHLSIYEHISDKQFLAEFFLAYLNRFFSIKSEGKHFNLSDFLFKRCV